MIANWPSPDGSGILFRFDAAQANVKRYSGQQE